MATEWLADLPSVRTARGLSGLDAASAVALDADDPGYNLAVQRHQATGDVVDEPWCLWPTDRGGGPQGGLEAHLRRAARHGRPPGTDVVVILSPEDHGRARARGAAWVRETARTLDHAFEESCRREGWRRRMPRRDLGLQIVSDGSADMRGARIGLAPGQFATAVASHLYAGPQRTSAPIATVYINLPGWPEFRQVAVIYDDQLGLTLGNHWLDSVTHPVLRAAGLYRITPDGQGGLVHGIRPDLESRFAIHVRVRDSIPFVTLATRSGDAVAHLVIEAAGGGSALAPAARDAAVTLIERGVLLQRVRFRDAMEGYDVHLGAGGKVGTALETPIATLQVRDRTSLSVEARQQGLAVMGRPAEPGTVTPLTEDLELVVAGEVVQIATLNGRDAVRWPYIAEVRVAPVAWSLPLGLAHGIGRGADSAVGLPDVRGNANIRWKPGLEGATTVRSSGQEIAKADFYTDSIMVASDHAVLDLTGPEPFIECTARQCYVYVRRGAAIVPLYPASNSGEHRLRLRSGDELLVGNSAFEVVLPGAPRAALPPPAPDFVVNERPVTQSQEVPATDSSPPPPPIEPAPAAGAPVLDVPPPVRTPVAAPPRAAMGAVPRMPPPPPLHPTALEDVLDAPAPNLDRLTD